MATIPSVQHNSNNVTWPCTPPSLTLLHSQLRYFQTRCSFKFIPHFWTGHAAKKTNSGPSTVHLACCRSWPLLLQTEHLLIPLHASSMMPLLTQLLLLLPLPTLQLATAVQLQPTDQGPAAAYAATACLTGRLLALMPLMAAGHKQHRVTGVGKGEPSAQISTNFTSCQHTMHATVRPHAPDRHTHTPVHANDDHNDDYHCVTCPERND